jgi:RHS repeat-associated protein
MKQGSEYYFYQNDHLGTPTLLTAANGNVVWSARYSVFGEATVDPGSSVINNLRFAGQYYDERTAYHYNASRYYDPKTGRYLTRDPIGLAGGINPYLYTNNDPINAVDPWGLWSEPAHDELIRQFGKLHGFTEPQVRSMMQGSVWADSMLAPGSIMGHQAEQYSYIHAMTSRAFPDKRKACVMANKFIYEHLEKYRGLLSGSISIPSSLGGNRGAYLRGTEYNPYFHLGLAMHTVMDSTSPSHDGFQFWTGSETPRHGPTSFLGVQRSHTEEDLPNLLANQDLIKTTISRMDATMNGGSFNCYCY